MLLKDQKILISKISISYRIKLYHNVDSIHTENTFHRRLRISFNNDPEKIPGFQFSVETVWFKLFLLNSTEYVPKYFKAN